MRCRFCSRWASEVRSGTTLCEQAAAHQATVLPSATSAAPASTFPVIVLLAGRRPFIVGRMAIHLPGSEIIKDSSISNLQASVNPLFQLQMKVLASHRENAAPLRSRSGDFANNAV